MKREYQVMCNLRLTENKDKIGVFYDVSINGIAFGSLKVTSSYVTFYDLAGIFQSRFPSVTAFFAFLGGRQ